MECAFPSSFLVRFPDRVGGVRGQAGLPPEDRGVRMGRPDVGTGRSGYGPGRMDPRVPRRPDRGAEMNNNPPLFVFSPHGSGQPLSRRLVLHTSPLADPAKPARPDKPSQDVCGLVGAQT